MTLALFLIAATSLFAQTSIVAENYYVSSNGSESSQCGGYDLPCARIYYVSGRILPDGSKLCIINI